jgi:hypothetical protein
VVEVVGSGVVEVVGSGVVEVVGSGVVVVVVGSAVHEIYLLPHSQQAWDASMPSTATLAKVKALP